MPAAKREYRLDIFMHGRDDTVLEQQFMTKSTTGYTSKPFGAGPDRFMLQPYGRYTNASRFAGEIDGLEAIESVREDLSDRSQPHRDGRLLDGRRVGMVYIVHYADRWAAAAPGAGFTETRVFLRGDLARQPQNAVQQTLWHMYDSTDYAVNTFNVPVVAYSGEIDAQKQAADAMAAAMREEGLTLEHIIGPNTGHAYEPGARQQVQDRLDQLAAKGRNRVPSEIRFTTWMLRYNKMFWVTVDAHGERSGSARGSTRRLTATPSRLTTANVTALHLTFDARPGAVCRRARRPQADRSTATTVALPAGRRDEVARVPALVKTDGAWKLGELPASDAAQGAWPAGPDRRCVHGQLRVRPADGQAVVRRAGQVGAASRLTTPISEWVHFFRGEPRVKNDTDVTAADIAAQQSRAVRRSVEQRRLQAHRRPAADPVARRAASSLATEKFDGQPRAGVHLSEPAQPEEVRRHQQRLHVPRSVEQRHAVAEAARLGGRRHHEARQQLPLPAAVRRHRRGSSTRHGS